MDYLKDAEDIWAGVSDISKVEICQLCLEPIPVGWTRSIVHRDGRVVGIHITCARFRGMNGIIRRGRRVTS